MGILMGFLRWIIRTLFVIAIVAFLLTSTLAYFTAKENLKPIIQEIGINQLSQDQIDRAKDDLNSMCQREGKESIEQYSSELKQIVKIDCRNITDEYTKELFKEQVIGTMFDNLYGQECKGLCFLSNPLLTMSAGAHSSLKNLEIIMFLAVLGLGAALFLVSSGISGRFFAIGVPLIFSGIPFFFIGSVKQQAANMLLPETAAIGSKVINLVVDYLAGIFFAIFAVGIALVIAGLIVKFTVERKGSKKKNEK